jgi:hypothetical protein
VILAEIPQDPICICTPLIQDVQDNQQGFGGNLSVQFDGTKPLLIFPHDESIFKQYTHSKKGWVSPDGKRVLVPKDDGQGVMISAIQSRELKMRMQQSANSNPH